MRVAVVGHGAMGRELEAALRESGHEPVLVPRGQAFPAACPVGVDFTTPASVVDNVRRALAAGARYVVGTTGWDERREEVRHLVLEAGGGLVHAANFSLGVNLFYRIVATAAELLARFPEYDPYVLERHHRRKKDAPSGTALRLAALVAAAGGHRSEPAATLAGRALEEAQFHVAALRAGGIVGDHTVGFDAGVDEILIEHRARSRRGFARGAVLAAEWIAGRTGFFGFDEVLDSLARGPGA
jgi:4-hydroxy-tetrahydrodipicolinate reductase